MRARIHSSTMSENGTSASNNIDPPPVAATSEIAASKALIQRVFIGPNGLRAGWRVAIFILLMMAFSFISRYVRQHLFHVAPRSFGGPFEPVSEIWTRGRGFLLLSAATLIMARIEHGKWEHYGLGLKRAFRSDFWIGCLWGLVSVSAVMGLLYVAGAYRVESFALSGVGLWKFAVLWGIMFLIVGLLEEFSLRGYLLHSLASGIGFWPAAVLTSLLFLAGHIGNSGENWLGLTDVFVIGMFLCFTLWRTGDLWFAVGLHAVWDWGLTYLYSVPNSGTTAVGHLLNVRVQGPTWLSGGSAGPEGSVINLVMDLVYFAVFAMIYKQRRWIGMNDRTRAAAVEAAPSPVVIDSSALSS